MEDKTLWINARLLAGGPAKPDGFVLTRGERIAALGQGVPKGVDAGIWPPASSTGMCTAGAASTLWTAARRPSGG